MGISHVSKRIIELSKRVLIINNFDQEVTKAVKDPNGNYIILEFNCKKKKYFAKYHYIAQMKINHSFI